MAHEMSLPDISSSPDPQRRIDLAGPVNFRDLGGYATADGQRVRWRRVFRSDSLGPVTPADASHLTEELGLVSVVDLRSTDEVEKEGRGALVDAAVEYHHLPLFEVVPGVRPEWPDTLHELYRRLLTDSADRVAAVLRVIASADAHPVVFHCVAGKDRTGVVAAVLLGLLGVGEDDVVADYALTQEVMPVMLDRWRLSSNRPDEKEFPAHVLQAEAHTMRRLLDLLDEDYGSLTGYARAGGVTDEVIGALRSHLLEPGDVAPPPSRRYRGKE
jgi:protein-tyrosine phosphatase